MRFLVVHDANPRKRGEAQGEAFRDSIHDLAAIRWELLARRSRIKDNHTLWELAHAHVKTLEELAPDLAEEFHGVASASGVDPESLIVLNNYTDIRDVGPDPEGEEGGCSIIYGRGADGPVVGQTWDMHATAEPFVCVLDLRGSAVPIPSVVFTVTGCLGMMGLNQNGLAVCINNLTPTDARIGLIWPALVRQMLTYPTAREALEHLQRAQLGSGHNYFIADESNAWNVETTGERKVVTTDDPGSCFWHTNHYLSDELQPLEAPIYPTSTTKERYEKLCKLMGGETQLDIQRAKDILGSHEGYPRSICSHPLGDGDPSSSKTCGAVVCSIRDRALHAAAGCVHGAEYHVFDVNGEVQ